MSDEEKKKEKIKEEKKIAKLEKQKIKQQRQVTRNKYMFFGTLPIVVFIIIMGITNRATQNNYIYVYYEVESNIKLVLNKDYKVVKVEDEQNLLDISIEDNTINQATKIIIDTFKEQKELNDVSDVVLISVENDNYIKLEIEKSIEDGIIPLIQTVSNKEDLDRLVNIYSITKQKANLVRKINEKDNDYDIIELVNLSIKQLYDILNGKAEIISHKQTL